ncbi:unnamed protein product [Schistosoma margrebowiei]|uniref:Uncharacterized protein n=1 Tax=Schistosoma margrebowiei TaxID=48269 RepID=A0A183M9I8_9TREM|nr:unnamed protein product [Schistosoma margrebowiei]
MKYSVDAKLLDKQAEFRKDRSCKHQVVTLRIIVEQSIEWNSSLYINFIDYEKAFDSVDRTTLWRLLWHYGIPEKILNPIRNSYDAKDRRQARLLTLTLSLFLVIACVMKMSTSVEKRGIEWTAPGRSKLHRRFGSSIAHATTNIGDDQCSSSLSNSRSQ